MVYKECTSYSGKTLEFLKCVMVSFMFESTNIISGISVASPWAHLGGGFKYFLFSPRILGEMIQIDEHIFQMGGKKTTN